MKHFEQVFPWVLVLSAIIAISVGMENSPAMIPVSTTVLDGGGELLPPEVYYMDESESIEELVAADLQHRDLATRTRIYIPYQEANKVLETSYAISHVSK